MPGTKRQGLGIPLTFLHFSRGFEAEADYLGIEYMYRAGYDPSAFVSFFEKIQAMEKKKPGTLSKAFDTHPQTPDRIEKSQDEIRKILPAKAQYIVTTSEFDEVKARLAAIENKHKVLDQKDSNKPSLRRTSNTSDNSGDTTERRRPSNAEAPRRFELERIEVKRIGVRILFQIEFFYRRLRPPVLFAGRSRHATSAFGVACQSSIWA